MGKIMKRTMIKILVLYPYPKIAATTGARAGTGTNWVRKRNGNRIAYIPLFKERIIPRIEPSTNAILNPKRASLKLYRDLVNTV
jgi:hypothetical protein